MRFLPCQIFPGIHPLINYTRYSIIKLFIEMCISYLFFSSLIDTIGLILFTQDYMHNKMSNKFILRGMETLYNVRYLISYLYGRKLQVKVISATSGLKMSTGLVCHGVVVSEIREVVLLACACCPLTCCHIRGISIRRRAGGKSWWDV